MKIYEIREMSSDEIVKRIDEEENNLVDLKFQHELKQLTNTAKLKEIRRDIARMQSELKNRETVNSAELNKE
ncbi:MAG: 50S ribosomal protein L29 [Melioribacteraceae bacterium]|nr:50S ribosomal protein L29 [Melioribacteraceae bacterium]